MIVPDVNLLLYATISFYDVHEEARDWWQSVLNGSEPIGLTDASAAGFVRIATNRRMFDRPLAIEDAADEVEAWLSLPHVRLLPPGPRHLETALGFLRGTGAGGNLTTDAVIASYAVAHRGTVYSNDSDFDRFEGVRRVDPLVTRRP